MTTDYDFTALINGIHQAILDEKADDESIKHWSSVLSQDGNRISELLPLLIKSKTFSSKLSSFFERFYQDTPFIIENSQNGEIFALLNFLMDTSIKNKIVVDVGANGKLGSNSYDLLKRFAWKGLLIEANPNLASKIHDDFSGLDYALVTAAVSNQEGSATFFVSTGSESSSLREENVMDFAEVREKIQVDVRRLPNILAEHRIPNDFGLLSIDAEGEDLNILNDTIASGYRPQWIIFEDYLPKQKKGIEEVGVTSQVKDLYEMAGATYANMFLRRR